MQVKIDGKLGMRIWRSSVLLVLGLITTACVTTETKQTQPTAVAAVAKSNQAYTVRRAAVRTVSTARKQPLQRPRAQRHTPKQLTKAQYHARYQAQKRAEAKAVEAQRQAAIRARIAQEKAEAEATRKRYIAKWQHTQQKRLAYNKNWQQEQLAQQRRAQLTARKAEAERKLAARKASTRPQATKATAHKPTARHQQAAKQERPDPRAKYLARWQRMLAEKRLEAKRAEQRVERVIHSAKKQIGRKYVWGGASPKRGFDCSGLVQHAISKGARVSVPRTAYQQYQASIKVPPHNAERGDLVFFITRGKQVSHVGIYLGDNKFVHAPRRGRTVTTSQLKGYWKKRFVSFGRIPGACRLPMPPKA